MKSLIDKIKELNEYAGDSLIIEHSTGNGKHWYLRSSDPESPFFQFDEILNDIYLEKLINTAYLIMINNKKKKENKIEKEHVKIFFDEYKNKKQQIIYILSEIRGVDIDLPKEYLEKGDRFYTIDNNTCLFIYTDKENTYWKVGKSVNKEDIKKWLPVLEKAGERLKKIKNSIKEKEVNNELLGNLIIEI